MFLTDLDSNGLIQVLNLDAVFDPFTPKVRGRTQEGEDTMDEGEFDKERLVFPSGEALPLCWRDSNYRRR